MCEDSGGSYKTSPERKTTESTRCIHVGCVSVRTVAAILFQLWGCKTWTDGVYKKNLVPCCREIVWNMGHG
jgi:hypothetical protein